jgi:hypothetical protein
MIYLPRQARDKHRDSSLNIEVALSAGPVKCGAVRYVRADRNALAAAVRR